MVTDTPEHGRLHFALMSEALASNAGIERAYARLYTSFRQLGTSWIRREIAEGRLRNDIDQEGMTVAVIAALLGVHLQKELDPDSIDLDAAYDALATILKQGMAPVGAPRPAHRD